MKNFIIGVLIVGVLSGLTNNLLSLMSERDDAQIENIDTEEESTSTSVEMDGSSCQTGGKCALGDTGPAGGVVFYAAETKRLWGQYMEVAKLDWANNQACSGSFNFIDDYAFPNFVDSSLGKGKKATEYVISKLIDMCSSSRTAGMPNAFIAAQNLTINGYDDWFIPTIDEFREFYQYKELRKILGVTGYGDSGWPSETLNCKYILSSITQSDFRAYDTFMNTWGTYHLEPYCFTPIRYFDSLK